MASSSAEISSSNDAAVDVDVDDDDVPECPICLDVVIEPVVLPCKHELCLGCVEEQLRKTSLECPVCRRRIGTWVRRCEARNRPLVDQDRWAEVQERYGTQIEARRKREGKTGSTDVGEVSFHKVQHVLAKPGEIRKEYESEVQKELREQERLRQEEETLSSAKIAEIKQENDDSLLYLYERYDQELAKYLAKGYRYETAERRAAWALPHPHPPAGDQPGTSRDMAGPSRDMAGPSTDLDGPSRDTTEPSRDMPGPSRDEAASSWNTVEPSSHMKHPVSPPEKCRERMPTPVSACSEVSVISDTPCIKIEDSDGDEDYGITDKSIDAAPPLMDIDTPRASVTDNGCDANSDSDVTLGGEQEDEESHMDAAAAASVDATVNAAGVDATVDAASVDATVDAASVDATVNAASVDATVNAASVDATVNAATSHAAAAASALVAMDSGASSRSPSVTCSSDVHPTGGSCSGRTSSRSTVAYGEPASAVAAAAGSKKQSAAAGAGSNSSCSSHVSPDSSTVTPQAADTPDSISGDVEHYFQPIQPMPTTPPKMLSTGERSVLGEVVRCRARRDLTAPARLEATPPLPSTSNTTTTATSTSEDRDLLYARQLDRQYKLCDRLRMVERMKGSQGEYKLRNKRRLNVRGLLNIPEKKSKNKRLGK